MIRDPEGLRPGHPGGKVGSMTAWSTAELDQIATNDELEVAGRGNDGKLNDPVTIWVVRHGNDLYVRSFKGTHGKWYRGTRASHQGHIHSGSVDKDVTFVDETDSRTITAIDEAYKAKYRHYQQQIVDPMLAAPARQTTMRLVPR
jgi:hypothetical protein